LAVKKIAEITFDFGLESPAAQDFYQVPKGNFIKLKGLI